MPEYKLSYFDHKGRAELIRLIFQVSGTKFIDHRVAMPDWPALKPKIPHGCLPALEVDGKIYGESLAIARYVANATGLAGKTPEEKFRADELVDNIQDFAKEYFTAGFEKDEAKKAVMLKEFGSVTAPKYLEKFTKLLKANGGNFFVGTSLTWADLAVFNCLEQAAPDPTSLDKLPELKTFKKKIEGIPKISAYLKARPKTEY